MDEERIQMAIDQGQKESEEEQEADDFTECLSLHVSLFYDKLSNRKMPPSLVEILVTNFASQMTNSMLGC